MTLKEFKGLLRLCRLVGIETVQDLQRFSREEREKGEGIAEALERYYNYIKK